MTSLLIICGLLTIPAKTIAQQQVPPATATLSAETAWTGEPLSLRITLFSPGPFSGAATFDFPEVPGLFFVNTGSPTVGTRTIDGSQYTTQDHRILVVSQRDGANTIPPFTIRYNGRPSFTADPEPLQTTTPELRFTTQRPPGMENDDVVVVAAKLDFSQSWSDLPDDKKLAAGDALVRTITRSTENTSAIMLPPPPISAPEGVKVYLADPVIEDKFDRGDLNATRTDEITYQFQNGGSFTLPDLTFDWWNPDTKSIQSATLIGQVVEVTAPPAPPLTEKVAKSPGRFIIFLLILAVILWRLPWIIRATRVKWHAFRTDRERLATRKVAAACRAHDATQAHTALNQWLLLTRAQPSPTLDLEQTILAQVCYGTEPETTSWSGRALLNAFKDTRRHALSQGKKSSRKSPLPALNPTWRSKTF
ncbi:MAG: BatD family protein [Verrucomicrobiota bacterium]